MSVSFVSCQKSEMESLNGTIVINQEHKTFSTQKILADAKLIVILFSASWCREATGFLHKIRKVYEESKKRRAGLEIIYASMDTEDEEMLAHFHEQGNWYAFAFRDETIHSLMYRFNITHVPCVVVMKPDGTIITKKGVEEIERLGINVLVTWSY